MITKQVLPFFFEFIDNSDIFKSKDSDLIEYKEHNDYGNLYFSSTNDKILLTSLDENDIIKKDEYCFDVETHMIVKTRCKKPYKYRKIIAIQPQIPPSYITKIINDGKTVGISDFEIEMIEKYIDPIGNYSNVILCDSEIVYQPKLTDGYITIVENMENKDKEFKEGDIIKYDNGTIQQTFIVYTVGENYLFSTAYSDSGHNKKYCSKVEQLQIPPSDGYKLVDDFNNELIGDFIDATKLPLYEWLLYKIKKNESIYGYTAATDTLRLLLDEYKALDKK